MTKTMTKTMTTETRQDTGRLAKRVWLTVLALLCMAVCLAFLSPGTAATAAAKTAPKKVLKTASKEVPPKTTSKTTTKTKNIRKKSIKNGYQITTEQKIVTKTTEKTKPEKMKQQSKKTWDSKPKKSVKTKTEKVGKNTTRETVTTAYGYYRYKKNSIYRVKVTKQIVMTTTTTITKIKLAVAPTPEPSERITYFCDLPSNVNRKAGVVATAFRTLGHKVKIDPSVNFSGLYDGKNQLIILHRKEYMEDSSGIIYHELGHFLGFIAGNVDTSAEFKQIYAKEKQNYDKYNKTYVISSSQEYFAEAYKYYLLDAAYLKKRMPETYAYVKKAVQKLTPEYIQQVKIIMGCAWTY